MQTVTDTRSELLDAALDYARRGWSVFPCRPRGKEPLTKHGVLDATTDTAQIIAWWTRWLDANIGIATGATSGFFVLDIDPQHGGDVGLDLLESEYGLLPDTVESCTGSDGRHKLFQYSGFRVRNSVGRIAAGCDIRGDGGYIIAPPSIHPTGEPYEWEITHGPDNCVIAPAPPWLLAKIRVLGNDDSTRDTTSEPQSIPEGQRNESLFKLACAMRAKGMGAESILVALLSENQQRCCPPLDESEVQKIAASSSKYTPSIDPHPDEDDEALSVDSLVNTVMQFPLDPLAEPLRAVVVQGAATLRCPYEYLAVPLLALAGAAIGATHVIEVKKGWRESATLFTAVIAPPGSKKSPALKLAATPLMRRQDELYRSYKETKEKYRLKLAQYEIDLASWKQRTAKGTATATDKPQEPEEPLLDQVFTTDATLVPCLASSLAVYWGERCPRRGTYADAPV